MPTALRTITRVQDADDFQGPPTTNQFLQWNGNKFVSAAGGSPGGTSGQLQVNQAGTFAGTPLVTLQSNGVWFVSQNTTAATVVVKGTAGQTGNLTSWQNSAGQTRAFVDPAGNATFGSVTSNGFIQTGNLTASSYVTTTALRMQGSTGSATGTLGNLTNWLLIQDGSGNTIGYVPIYDSIS